MTAMMTQTNEKERRRRGRRDGQKAGPKNTPIQHPNRSSQPTRSVTVSDKQHTLSYKPHNTLLVQFTEQTPTWYECGRNTPGRDDIIPTSGGKLQKSNTREIVNKYRRLADEIYNHEVSLSRSATSNSSSDQQKDEKWVENTMKRGTLKDRIAAMSVVASMDCIHKLYALDMLLDLAGCGVDSKGHNNVPNSRIGQMASEALADLFINTLLPGDRKLISLEQRPLYQYEKKTLSPRILLLWRYEEMMKIRYASYLQRYLGRTLGGEDELSKKNALVTASSLLKEVPEGEEVLLTLIVNKIGDPGKKIASAAGHQLRGVLEEHPVMVNVVAREVSLMMNQSFIMHEIHSKTYTSIQSIKVQQLAHRPHLSPKALYNCVIFLNQLQLSRDDEDDVTSKKESSKPTKSTSLPASLINTYFHLFEMTVQKDNKAGKKKKGKHSNNSTDSSGMKSRLLSALLTGVNRAHPYLPRKDAAMEQHIDALYRISHTAPPAAATQALMLLFQLAVGSGEEAQISSDSDGNKKRGATNEEDSVTMRKDRFYRALYSKIGVGDMFSGRQLTLFFNLLYKAMKYDDSTQRICAFAKRLMHTVIHQSQSIICGTLFLLSEIVKSHPEILTVGSDDAGEVSVFDPTKREPRAAFDGKGASLSRSLWELSLLVQHFHPSVSKFASNIEGDISYAGDPLKDFALAPFLDKFAFRNPKSMKPKKEGIAAGRKTTSEKAMGLPMNDPSFLEAENIPAEEKFFHQFFVERAKRDEIKGIIRGNGDAKGRNEAEDLSLIHI